jgi:hypothetical protein
MNRRQARRAARHGERLGRAGARIQRTLLHAAEAMSGAQWVIAWRVALLQHAMADIRRVGDPEFARMVTEKVEAALAVAPAMVGGFARTQMEFVRIWQAEVAALGAAPARFAVTGSPLAAAEVAGEVAAEAADRSAGAALDLMIANTRLMASVLAPYHRRIRGNVRRMGGV